MSEFDAVLIGAGHNSLAAALHLAAKGWQTTGIGRVDLHARHGLTATVLGDDDPMREIIYISGTLG